MAYLPKFSAFAFCYISLIFLTVLVDLSVFADLTSVDLCGGSKLLDLSPFHNRSPWSVSKRIKNTDHLIDILPCNVFNSLGNGSIPENCKNSSLCHKITTNKTQTYIGYVPVKVVHEFDTYRIRYVGPHCANDVNYTIDIRFICGNHLGYPSFPSVYLSSNCSKFLNWETSVVCKHKKDQPLSFGLNEMRCYVNDDSGNRRDLTPLIRQKGSYQVLSSSGEQFYINVCSDASDKCGLDGSSACIRNKNGVYESTGSYKWSDIEFHPSSELTKHEYIELTYNSQNRRCKMPNNTSVTKIRFICPKNFANDDPSRRSPILVSNLDCDYEVEWITDYACPQSETILDASSCKFDNLDFNRFANQTDYEINGLEIDAYSKNVSILLNICGPVKYKSNPRFSSVYLLNNTDSGSSKSIGSLHGSQFIKADNRLKLVYSTKLASCVINGDNKIERTTIEFECDHSAGFGKPEFVDYQDCSYLLKWKTDQLCPMFAPNPDCIFIDNDRSMQIDLSSLSVSSPYIVQRYQNDPKIYYKFSSDKQILLNICDVLPFNNQTKNCNNSSACLIDKKTNTSISLGRFTKPLTYNSELNAVELVYTDGFDPRFNRTTSTKINFHCKAPNYDNQPFLIDYDEKTGQYTIEFNTLSACPLQEIKGDDCIVVDPIADTVYNLNSLRAEHHYSVKGKDARYEFELNVCGPVRNGSCGENVAICQKERNGDHRSYSLGASTSSLRYWNAMLNMTFVGGTAYNDKAKTPRTSHISFICDSKAGKGHPEFDGEKDQAYFFRWYTSLACPGPVPAFTHCVFENATHFFDLTPLSLDRGNHFVLGEKNSIAYINFCRPLNKIRENYLQTCKPNSGICLINNFNLHSNSMFSLGEPVGHPFFGFDGNIYLLYNNGDRCSSNSVHNITSRVRLECDTQMDQELSITFIDPNEHFIEDGDNCTYEFIVRTPLACPKKFEDLNTDQCAYVDKRTNLSADFTNLINHHEDYSITAKNGDHSLFTLNMCKSVNLSPHNCKDAAVCLREADNSYLNYGSVNSTKIYNDGKNLHVRYTGGSVCNTELDNRQRSTDIEFICDHKATASSPTLYYYNSCFAKFQWRVNSVCNLVVPSCSLIDYTTGHFYSLRQLSSLSHVWNVSIPNKEEHYLINVCKPLPVDHNCGSSSAVCKCVTKNGTTLCNTSVGHVSDHELSLDDKTQDLILTYEDDQTCQDGPLRTQIRFKCSNESGLAGPTFINVNYCTHNFIWYTMFACSKSFLESSATKLLIDKQGYVIDKQDDMKWNFSPLFERTFHSHESLRPTQNYTYVFNFNNLSAENDKCSNAAICQTKPGNFYRDVGSQNNWQLNLIGSDLHMIVNSATSKCGRNLKRNASTRINFHCSPSAGIGSPIFIYEGEDCDYFFDWDSSAACQIGGSISSANALPSSRSAFSVGWTIFMMSLLAVFVFAGWLFMSNSPKRDHVVFYIRKVFRRNQPPQIPFRYQQLSL